MLYGGIIEVPILGGGQVGMDAMRCGRMLGWWMGFLAS